MDNAGKSTLIKQISSGNTNLSHNLKPTEGFNITILQKGEYTLNIFELGGQENVRRFWNTYFEDTDLLVFVVDSVDQSKLPVAASELKNLLGDQRLSTVPILIIANKQVSNVYKLENIEVGTCHRFKLKIKNQNGHYITYFYKQQYMVA